MTTRFALNALATVALLIFTAVIGVFPWLTVRRNVEMGTRISECSAVCRYDTDGRAESCRLHCPKWEGVCRVQMTAIDEGTGLPWTSDGWSGR